MAKSAGTVSEKGMTRLSDKVAAVVAGEESAGRLVCWNVDQRPGVFTYELQYYDARHAHDLAGILYGLGVIIDSHHTQLTSPNGPSGYCVSSLTFRVGSDAYVIQDNACPACKGKGHMGPKLEPCWHCDGEGFDPAP